MRRRSAELWLLWLVALGLATACAARRSSPEPVGPPSRPAAPPVFRDAADQAASPAATGAPPAGTPPAPAAVIDRRELSRWLDEGAQRFMQKVELNPSLEQTPRGRRFIGWELGAFFPGDPRFFGVDLRVGDVVTRVNGRPIERPEQFIRVWEELRFARELVVDYLRKGERRRLRFEIR